MEDYFKLFQVNENWVHSSNGEALLMQTKMFKIHLDKACRPQDQGGNRNNYE